MREEEVRSVLCVAATFTADPLRDPLEFWWRELDMDLELRLAPYGQLFQQLLDPAGVIRANRSGANALLVRWADLEGGSSGAGTRSRGEARVRLARELVEAVEATSLPVPTAIVLGPPREELEASREAEALLRDRLGRAPGISILGASELDLRYPVESPHDDVSDRFGHVPFTPSWFVAAATAIARWQWLASSAPRKVLVLDCDNTLWGGVVGEDGPRGLRVDGPWEALQRFMVRQSEGGRLLCLCSKNEEADVLRVFDERPDMPLRREHILAHRIGWGPKPRGVQELARELDLGLDSFVFLDDNPVEVAEMRAACPEVLALQLPGNPALIPPFLEHAWPLDLGKVNEDDRRRNRAYADNLRRAELKRDAPTLATFLERLELRVELGPATAPDLARLAQLTQRTNQFNASTVRLSEAELSARLEDDLPVSMVVKASDRFGDYGTVGLALGRPVTDALRIEMLLMSCRALGRGIEHRLLARLGEIAEERGLERVEVVFRPTVRNTPVRLFLEEISGPAAADTGETLFAMPSGAARDVVYRPAAVAEPRPAPGEALRQGGRGEAPSETFQRVAKTLTTTREIEDALATRTRPRGDMGQAFVEPAPGLESRIAAIWREVLRLDRVGARDGFQDLGGRSLHLVRVHRLLLDRLEVDLDITTLFQHPTVAGLAAHLRESGEAGLPDVSERARRMRAGLARQAAVRRGSRQGRAM